MFTDKEWWMDRVVEMDDDGFGSEWVCCGFGGDSEMFDWLVQIQVEKNEDFSSNMDCSNILVDTVCDQVLCIECVGKYTVLYLYVETSLRLNWFKFNLLSSNKP